MKLNQRRARGLLAVSLEICGLILAWHATIQLRLLLNPVMAIGLTESEIYRLAPPLSGILLLWGAASLWLRMHRPARRVLEGVTEAAESALVTGSLAIAIIFFSRELGADLSRAFALLFLPVSFVVLVASRWLAKVFSDMLNHRWQTAERIAVIGEGAEARRLVDRIRARGNGDVRVTGLILPERALAVNGENQVPVLGNTRRLAEVINRHALDRIVILNGCTSEREADECGSVSKRMGVVFGRTLSPPPEATAIDFADYCGVPMLELRAVPFTRRQELLKRCLDVLGSSAALVLLSPLMLVCAALVKFTSSGPILYRAQRVGKGGRYFTFLKFRSMYANSDQLRHTVRNEQGGHLFKIRHDPRVTPVGQFLRRYSLDELPQLFNVLLGDMSLVGPRPLPAEDLDTDGQSGQFALWSERRSSVLPGITGLWQIRGRSNLGFEKMMDLDIQYIREWSILLDLQLLLETPRAVLCGDGAY